MIPAGNTQDEAQRLNVLRSFAVLDTLPNRALNEITELAAQICDVPTSVISLIDEDRQWYKAKIGWDLQGTPRSISFCGHAIQEPDLMIVPDATLDERFKDNPLVTGPTGVRFYAGAPLISPTGFILGTLCVIDRVPRTLTPLQQKSLRVLSHQVMTHLELHRQKLGLVQREKTLQIVTDNARVGLVIVDRDRRYAYANAAYAEVMGLNLSSVIGLPVAKVLSSVYDQISPQLDKAFDTGERVEYELVKPDVTGDKIYEIKYQPVKDQEMVMMVVVVITNITEQKRSESSLQRLAAIVEFSYDAIISKDLDGNILSWNKGAEAIFGYTADEIIGNSISRLFLMDSLLEEEMLKKIRSGERVEPFESLRQTKDGRIIDVSVTASPILNSAGVPIGISEVSRDITTRKKAERQLDLLKTCVSKLNDMVIVTEADLIDEPGPRIVFVNEAFERVTGYSASEAIGKSPRFLQGKGTDKNTLREIRQALLERKPIRRQFANYRKDGVGIYVDMDIVPIFNPTGKGNHFVAIQRDITDIRNSEARFQTLFEHATNGILTANTEGICISVNKKMEALLGCKKADLLGKHLSGFMIEDNSAQIQAAIEAIKSGVSYHQEWKLRHTNGTFFIAEVIATLMPDGDLLGVFRDVTERKRSEERIAEQAAFLDKARDAILVKDLQGKILFWNRGAQRIYGWTADEALGKDVRQLLFRDSKQFDQINSSTMSRGEWNGELIHLTKDKQEVVIESRWTLICDGEGGPKSVLDINTDITDKKKIESQFMRAQRMESIGTLASGVAHDLNNILAPILMSIAILKEFNSSPDALSVLETIEISAKRGGEIVRQVLSFASGLEGQRVELHFNQLLKSLETIIRETFPKNIRMRFSISPDTWKIFGDPTQVYQILLNLCVNARDAMPNGGDLSVYVENCVLDTRETVMNVQSRGGRYVTKSVQAGTGRYVTLTVTDSGMGIPIEIIDKIFEPFFTTKSVDQGTGLGLSTVLAIAKSHGGAVNAYSENGKGATFKVYLPVLEEVAVSNRLEEDISLPRGNGETVLVVDDEASIRVITSQTLLAFGYRVLTATDGADALSIYVQNKNDIAVVIIDIIMPVLDGLATINALTRINPSVKIVGASGVSQDAAGSKSAGHPIKHFLIKPYTATSLLTVLKTVLAQS